jgi:8-oxo-dGTP pyrophosphatase MutT (NUDIX family)
MKAVKRVGIQYAALPYRIEGRQVEVMLITSRGTQRWVIPKGWPMQGLRPQDAAATEAVEEAGLLGELEEQPIGAYRYAKQLKAGRAIDVQVIVFALRVTGQADEWKEQSERSWRWFRYRRAAGLVAEPGLKRLIREIGAAHTPTLLARGLRTYRSWRLIVRGWRSGESIARRD